MNAGYDSCALLYSTASTTPPANNVMFCGTENSGSQNSLWALKTTDGTLSWSNNTAGRIEVRPQLHPSKLNLYFGTMDGSVRAHDSSTGSSVWSSPLTLPGAQPVSKPTWAEFRPSGYTDTLLVTTVDGVLHRVVDNGTSGWHNPTTTSAASPGTLITTIAAIFPSRSQAYIGQDDGTVHQVDLATGNNPASGMYASSASLGMGTVSDPALDFNDFSTSTDIDRLTVSVAGGVNPSNVKRYCVPWGTDSPWVGATSVPGGGPGPQPRGPCPPPVQPGDCTCDQQCAGRPSGPCAVPHCDIRNNDTEGTCMLVNLPDGTACDDSNACTCDGAAAHLDANGLCITPCANCDICMNGQCGGPSHKACTCTNIGDPACAAGQVCCGAVGCVDLSSDIKNCGECGKACASGQKCAGSVCVRDQSLPCKPFSAANLGGNIQGCSPTGGAGNQCIAGTAGVAYANATPGFCDAFTSTFITDTQTMEPASTWWLSFNAGGTPIVVKQWADPAGNFVPENGLTVSPDGAYTNAISYSGGLAHMTFVNAGTGANVVAISQGPVWSATDPFPQTQYDSGWAGPVFMTKNYVRGQTTLTLFVANTGANGFGDVGYVQGHSSPTGGGYTWDSTVTNLKNFNPAHVEALAYALRPSTNNPISGPDGVLYMAYACPPKSTGCTGGPRIDGLCNTITNAGQNCSNGGSYSFTIDLNNVWADVDRGNSALPPIAFFNAMVGDSYYGDIYFETRDDASLTVAQNQLYFLSEKSIVPGNIAPAIYVNNLLSVQIDQHFPASQQAQLFWKDNGARLGMAPNGLLERTVLSTAPPGAPSFIDAWGRN
jgi:hypothetical protein